MMLRRTFATPEGRQVLVTVHVETGDVIAAVRDESWDTWSRPLEEVDRQDDEERGRRRGYPEMVVVDLSEVEPAPPPGE